MYIDNTALHAALAEYLAEREIAVASGEEIPQLTNYIGESIYLLCTNLAKRPNFSGYSFVDDMIDSGIEICIRYIHNYDFRRFTNPHAFLTQYAWRGFVNVINAEEEQSYFKAKLAISPDEISDSLAAIDADYQLEADTGNPFFDVDAYEAKRKKVYASTMTAEQIIGLDAYIEEISSPGDVFSVDGENN